MAKKYDFTIQTLGQCKIKSPINLSNVSGDLIASYVSDDQYIQYEIEAFPGKKEICYDRSQLLEVAGPREMIFYDPSKVHAGIVTCGGLCPGLNVVIRSIVLTLWHRYNVKRISGVQYGYRGLLPEFKLPIIDLNPESIANIHTAGGTVLGSSRGGGDRFEEIVDTLEQLNINVLFTIGGDGTQKGADKIAEEALRRGLKLAVIGIPKTIDNDFSFIERSFGFETAVEKSVIAVHAAHTEAKNSINGISIVKVMGRESGFIAVHNALATNEVNYVLIPEVPFEMDGEHGLLINLKQRLERSGHAVILVAEGAGQDILGESSEVDASGNKKLKDIGAYLKEKIKDYFEKENFEITLKYIDPSYIIRSAPANSNDSIYCQRLGQNAVHAAMAGKTRVLIGRVNYRFVHVPIRLAVSERNKINPESPIWRDVTEATGQPLLLGKRIASLNCTVKK